MATIWDRSCNIIVCGSYMQEQGMSRARQQQGTSPIAARMATLTGIEIPLDADGYQIVNRLPAEDEEMIPVLPIKP
eukprot:5159335-Amphidinium_carterae.1